MTTTDEILWAPPIRAAYRASEDYDRRYQVETKRTLIYFAAWIAAVQPAHFALPMFDWLLTALTVLACMYFAARIWLSQRHARQLEKCRDYFDGQAWSMQREVMILVLVMQARGNK